LQPAPEPTLQQSVTKFEGRGDLARSWPNHLVRDAAYLNWRYVDSPRGYATVRRGDEYAIVGHKLHKGRRIALVADLVGSVRPLLKECVRRVRRDTQLLFALPARGQRAAYAASGFVPTPMTLHFMGKALAGRFNTDPAAWRFTLGDTDFF
jgi:hypothetical protein